MLIHFGLLCVLLCYYERKLSYWYRVPFTVLASEVWYIYFLFHLVLRSLKVLQLSFKQQNWYQKHKNAKTMTLHRTWKRYLFTLWELKQGRRVSVSLISAGNMSIGWLTFSLLHACLWMTMNVPWILILGLQIYLACSRIHKYTLRIMSTDCT